MCVCEDARNKEDLVGPTWTRMDKHLCSRRAQSHSSFRQNTCFLALPFGYSPRTLEE